jgi:hypothetical protein
MSTTSEHLTEATRAGREAMSTVVRSVAETGAASTVRPAGRAGGVRPGRLLDAWFDVADEALAAQREFLKAALSMGNPALDAMTLAAQRTVEATCQYAMAAAEEPAGPAPAQG